MARKNPSFKKITLEDFAQMTQAHYAALHWQLREGFQEMRTEFTALLETLEIGMNKDTRALLTESLKDAAELRYEPIKTIL